MDGEENTSEIVVPKQKETKGKGDNTCTIVEAWLLGTLLLSLLSTEV